MFSEIAEDKRKGEPIGKPGGLMPGADQARTQRKPASKKPGKKSNGPTVMPQTGGNGRKKK